MLIKKVDTFAGHRDCVYALAPGSEPAQFFSAGADGQVVRWRLDKPDLGRLVARIPSSVYAITYDETHELLWVGQNYEGLHLIQPDQQRETHSVKLTTAAIFDIQLIDDLALLALSDGVVIVLDTSPLPEAPPVVRKHLKASNKSARSISIRPDKNEFAVGYSDNDIRIFDLQSLELKHLIAAHTNSVFTVCYSPDSRYLLSAGRDAHLKIWDVAQHYKPLESIPAHLFAINHIAYHPDGTLFATCSMDKSVKVWDAQTFRLLKVIDRARHAGHGTSVNKLWWSSFHQQLVSCGDDKLISVWEVSR
ncbi:WD40 repeat domain-containing protein [Tellurirhabdus bombi]|uniref:WD40 repeat domain-containing protein n=1 Tax=Tellurirhabdus bombi TaxID=2907205 RepID=UPI001F302CD4|nr:WD40 repeat domain-containing protein [Tellurirhabdus bombi]